MTVLMDLAAVVRSKNAGPYRLTFDIMFHDPDAYHRVKRGDVLAASVFADLYRVPVERVTVVAYDQALAFKATIPRETPAGSVRDTDVQGVQQATPLLTLVVP